jgi:hypothetical protein
VLRCLAGVYPPLNTLHQRDLSKKILDSIKSGYRVSVFGQIRGRENNLKVEDGGLKVPTPEPVEDDSQKIQGRNGLGKSGSHPLDGFLNWGEEYTHKE